MANGLPRLPDLTGGLPDLFPANAALSQPSPQEKKIRKLVRGKPEAKIAILKEFEEQSIAESAFEVLSNAGAEARDMIIGLPILGFKAAKAGISALANPIDTIESIASGEALAEAKDVLSELGGAIKDDYTQRFGPLIEGLSELTEGNVEGAGEAFDAFGEQLKDRPLSFLLDLGAASSLAGGGMRVLGGQLAKRTGIEGLEKTGTVLSNFGTAIEPINVAKRGVAKVGDILPDAPIIGANARVARQQRKLMQGLTQEELEIAHPNYAERVAKTDRNFADVTLQEMSDAQLHASGLDEIPLSRQTPGFKKALEEAKRVFRDENDPALFNISEEVVKRRRGILGIQRYIKEGRLKLTPEQEQLLKPFVKSTPTGRELVFNNLEELPDFLFDQRVTNQIKDYDHFIYIPTLDAEAALRAPDLMKRLSHKIANPIQGFQEDFSGAIANKYLTKRDPTVLADLRETSRQFIAAQTTEVAYQNMLTKLVNQIDPKTGARIAKPIYVGGTPKNLDAFANGRDFADVVNAIEKPLMVNSIDDVYKRAVGKTKEQYVKAFQATQKISREAAEDIAEREVIAGLTEQGYDGFLTKAGDVRVFDPTKANFGEVLPDHLVMSPSAGRVYARQRDLGRKVEQELASGKSMDKILRSLEKEQDLYVQARRSIQNAQKAKRGFINDKIGSRDGISKFLSQAEAEIADPERLKFLDKTSIADRIAKESAETAKIRATAGGFGLHDAYSAYQIPKEFADIADRTISANSSLNTAFKTFYDDPLQLWRTMVLNFSGRWHVNNFFGNLMLNTIAGVLNPIDYMRAGRLLAYRLKNEFGRQIGSTKQTIAKALGASVDDLDKVRKLNNAMSSTELAMSSFARAENAPLSLGAAAKTPMAKLQSKILQTKPGRLASKAAALSGDFNALVDQFFKEAHMFKLVRGQIRKQKKGVLDKIKNSIYASSDEIYDFVQNPNARKVTQLVDSVQKWLPNYTKLLNPTERAFVRRIVPFYSWYKHMASVGMMIPLNHPKRALLISQIGKLGKEINDEEFRANGIDPKDVRLVARWLENTVIVGKGKQGPKFLSLRGANPFQTLVEIPDIGNALSPPIKGAIERMTGVSLFTKRPLPTKFVVDKDGNVRRKLKNSVFDDLLLRQVPQVELIRRLANPNVEDVSGEIIYRRNSLYEVLKHAGVNINEQNIEKLKETAATKRGAEAGRALNRLLKSKRKTPEEFDQIEKLLSVISQ